MHADVKIARIERVAAWQHVTTLEGSVRLRYRNSVIEVNGMRFLGSGSNAFASGYYEVPLNSKGVYV